MSAAMLYVELIRQLAFGGPLHVLSDELKTDGTFDRLVREALDRMSRYYLRTDNSLVLRADWDENGRLGLVETGLLNSQPATVRIWPGDVHVPSRDNPDATALLLEVLDGSVALGSIQGRPDCHYMSGEVLANLLAACLWQCGALRDQTPAYQAWNWDLLGAEMGDQLREGVCWLRMQGGPQVRVPVGSDRASVFAGSMTAYLSDGEERERTWAIGTPCCAMKSVLAWMELDSVNEFVAGRMDDGQVALVLATRAGEEDQRWRFMVPATGRGLNILFGTLGELVSYARSCDDWPEDSPIKSWFLDLEESGLVG